MAKTRFVKVTPSTEPEKPGGVYVVMLRYDWFHADSIAEAGYSQARTHYEYAIASYRGEGRWDEILGENLTKPSREARLWYTNDYGVGVLKVKEEDEVYTIRYCVCAYCELPTLPEKPAF